MRIKWTVHRKYSYNDWYIGTQHIFIIIWNFFLKPLTSIDEIKMACEFPLSPNTYLASFSKVNENPARESEWVCYLLGTEAVGSLPSLLDVIGCVRMGEMSQEKGILNQEVSLWQSAERSWWVGGWSLIQLWRLVHSHKHIFPPNFNSKYAMNGYYGVSGDDRVSQHFWSSIHPQYSWLDSSKMWQHLCWMSLARGSVQCF